MKDHESPQPRPPEKAKTFRQGLDPYAGVPYAKGSLEDTERNINEALTAKARHLEDQLIDQSRHADLIAQKIVDRLAKQPTGLPAEEHDGLQKTTARRASCSFCGLYHDATFLWVSISRYRNAATVNLGDRPSRYLKAAHVAGKSGVDYSTIDKSGATPAEVFRYLKADYPWIYGKKGEAYLYVKSGMLHVDPIFSPALEQKVTQVQAPRITPRNNSRRARVRK